MARSLTRRSFAGAAAATTSAFSGIGYALAADNFVMRYSIPLGPGSLFYICASRMAEIARQRSNGRLSIEIYPNGQLAKERESIAGLTSGSVDMTTQASVWTAPLSADFQALDLPFLFRNVPAAYRFSESPLAAEMFAKLDAAGVVGMSWSPSGFREFETTSKAVKIPDDMKGLRMRIQAGPVFVALFQAVGSVPVTIDIAEVYTALSQHTCDGLDVSLDAFANQKLFNVVKNIAMSNHIFQFAPTLVSKAKLAAIGPELTQVLKDATAGAARLWWSLYNQRTIANINMLKNEGVNFTEIDYPKFKKAMEPVYAQFSSKFSPGLVDRLTKASTG